MRRISDTGLDLMNVTLISSDDSIITLLVPPVNIRVDSPASKAVLKQKCVRPSFSVGE